MATWSPTAFFHLPMMQDSTVMPALGISTPFAMIVPPQIFVSDL